MPIVVNTPFGQRVQDDPRDAVSNRQFAIMQGLASLMGQERAAQAQAQAQVRAAELEAQRSNAWAQAQERMSQANRDQERSLFELRANIAREQDATSRQQMLEDEARRRGWSFEDQQRMLELQDRMNPLNALTRESLQRVREGGKVPQALRPQLEAAGAIAPLVDPSQFADVQGAYEAATPKYGPALRSPEGFLDAAWMAATAPVQGVLAAGRGIGNMAFDESLNTEPLQDMFNSYATYYQQQGSPYRVAQQQAMTRLKEQIVAAGLDWEAVKDKIRL